jgi:hypothetical protein
VAVRGWPLKVAGAALGASLLLPWFYCTDEGQSFTTAGWDTEPGFTLGVLACACAIAIAGHLDRPLIAMLCTVPAIALTIWMLPRGERYSCYDLGPGAFITLALAALALGAATRQSLRR